MAIERKEKGKERKRERAREREREIEREIQSLNNNYLNSGKASAKNP